MSQFDHVIEGKPAEGFGRRMADGHTDRLWCADRRAPRTRGGSGRIASQRNYKSMPLFERPPLETLAPAKDRWTPLYLEHGRLEVDDSSVKWIGADGLLCRIPVATVSALILGPGTTVTHAAMKACAESQYARLLDRRGLPALLRLRPHAQSHQRHAPPPRRRLGRQTPPHPDRPRACSRCASRTSTWKANRVKELRGMEGLRVRALYAQLGLQHGVTWKGRNYDRRTGTSPTTSTARSPRPMPASTRCAPR